MKLAKAMATVAGLTGLSRIAGFIRDIMTAAILGAGPIADAFIVALKLPNLFRRITAEGAFSVSFVPVYSEMLEKDGRGRADAFAGNMFMVMLGLLSGFVLLAMWATPWLMYGIAPGFSDDPLRYYTAVELTRITFPYLVFMSLTALLGGVLNALNRFAPFAFAPVLFNVALIAALLMSDMFETAGHAMAWGVLAAGVLQLIWLLASAWRAGFRVKIALPRFDADVKKIFKLMGPGVVGAGVVQLNLFADMIIGSFMGTGAISYLYYADRLNQLPLGMIGIAVGTALLPMLSKAVAGARKQEASDLFNRAMEYCFLLGLPASFALAVFATPIIGTLFERGAFEALATHETSSVLMAYTLGLSAHIAIKVFSTVHWAHGDTKTPVKIAIAGTLFNIALSLVLIQFIGVAGIALATSVAGWLQFTLHWRVMKAREGFGFDDRFKGAFVKILTASGIMIGVTYGMVWGLEQATIEMHKIPHLILIVLTGSVIYGLSALGLGLITLDDVKSLIKGCK
ncbi:MAG: murein biosynthesis integral membrane protein MurJ [Alphaproteobacteria bacterium]|nr:murein biosynthesis integral membrane protein MurJ [Alphaproteobacteria bacterium]